LVGGALLFFNAFAVGGGAGGVEFDQHLAGSHFVAITHMDGANDTGFQRLHGLGSVAHHDAALRQGHDVHLAHDAPGQRQAEQSQDGPDGAAR
jgi:hypothetical protein